MRNFIFFLVVTFFSALWLGAMEKGRPLYTKKETDTQIIYSEQNPTRVITIFYDKKSDNYSGVAACWNHNIDNWMHEELNMNNEGIQKLVSLAEKYAEK